MLNKLAQAGYTSGLRKFLQKNHGLMKIVIIQAQGKDEKMMELSGTSSYLITWLAKLQSKNENNQNMSAPK